MRGGRWTLHWSQIDRRSYDSCWLWLGRIGDQGYPVAGFKGKERVARVVYEMMVGPIPQGLVLDHLCHTNDHLCPGGSTCPHRACVNPAHLEPVTNRENILRGRSPIARNAAKTHCLRGHEFTPSNTRILVSGGRSCRACIRERRHRYYRQGRAA